MAVTHYVVGSAFGEFYQKYYLQRLFYAIYGTYHIMYL
jgi:hypothetical protein